MDVRKFFDSVDHGILKALLKRWVKDEGILWVTDRIIDSFHSSQEGKGLPLGNVTSQLFANLYLHELDMFIKHGLREKFYLRYCDDFVLLSSSREHLVSLIPLIREFLAMKLKLELHPKKVSIRKLGQGIDFVGYVLFEKHILMRQSSKRRMKRRLKKGYDDFLKGKIDEEMLNQKLQSYLGILSHAQQHKLSEALKNAYGACFKNP